MAFVVSICRQTQTSITMIHPESAVLSWAFLHAVISHVVLGWPCDLTLAKCS